MNKYRQYLWIILGAAIGWIAAAVIPGFDAGLGIPLGGAVGLAIAGDRRMASGGCRSLLPRRNRRSDQRS